MPLGRPSLATARGARRRRRTGSSGLTPAQLAPVTSGQLHTGACGAAYRRPRPEAAALMTGGAQLDAPTAHVHCTKTVHPPRAVSSPSTWPCARGLQSGRRAERPPVDRCAPGAEFGALLSVGGMARVDSAAALTTASGHPGADSPRGAAARWTAREAATGTRCAERRHGTGHGEAEGGD